MSIQQAEEYQAMCQRTKGVEDSDGRVFIYDLPLQFAKTFPGARLRGAAYVKGWTFHVNVLGRVNIRQYFQSNVTTTSDYLFAGPGSKNIYDPSIENNDVFGLIFDLSKEDALYFEQKSFPARNKISLVASIEDPRTHTVQDLPVTAYADLRNTSDSLRRIVSNDSNDPLYRLWVSNLDKFLHEGISPTYLQKVFRQLQGRSIPHPQPVYVAPSDIFPPPLAPARASGLASSLLASAYTHHHQPAMDRLAALRSDWEPNGQGRPADRRFPSFIPRSKKEVLQNKFKIRWQDVGFANFQAHYRAVIPSCRDDSIRAQLQAEHEEGLESFNDAYRRRNMKLLEMQKQEEGGEKSALKRTRDQTDDEDEDDDEGVARGKIRPAGSESRELFPSMITARAPTSHPLQSGDHRFPSSTSSSQPDHLPGPNPPASPSQLPYLQQSQRAGWYGNPPRRLVPCPRTQALFQSHYRLQDSLRRNSQQRQTDLQGQMAPSGFTQYPDTLYGVALQPQALQDHPQGSLSFAPRVSQTGPQGQQASLSYGQYQNARPGQALQLRPVQGHSQVPPSFAPRFSQPGSPSQQALSLYAQYSDTRHDPAPQPQDLQSHRYDQAPSFSRVAPTDSQGQQDRPSYAEYPPTLYHPALRLRSLQDRHQSRQPSVPSFPPNPESPDPQSEDATGSQEAGQRVEDGQTQETEVKEDHEPEVEEDHEPEVEEDHDSKVEEDHGELQQHHGGDLFEEG